MRQAGNDGTVVNSTDLSFRNVFECQSSLEKLSYSHRST
jgi:hypothetical protein